MSNQQISVKEYDTIAIHCQYLNDNGAAISLANTNVIADIKSYDNEILEHLIVSVIDTEQGIFVMTTENGSLAPNKYLIDVLFESATSGRRVASETFYLRVNPAVTKPRWQHG